MLPAQQQQSLRPNSRLHKEILDERTKKLFGIEDDWEDKYNHQKYKNSHGYQH